MMKQVSPRGLLFITFVLAVAALDLTCVECKTIQRNSTRKSSLKERHRKLDNFVEFTDEGDQLAVESTGTVAAVKETEREMFGDKNSVSTTGRQCPNVQKAVYPVIPVIIASLVGLIGAIIISAIVRLVIRTKNESNDGMESSSEYGVPNYDRRIGNRNTGTLFGFDFKNLSRLTKTVLSAIEKIY